MKQASRLAIVVAALLVCAASASSLNGGAYPGPAIRDTPLGGGEHLVTVSGASMHTARDLAYGRARAVCGGAGFDALDGDVSKDERYVAHRHSTEHTSVTHVADNSTYDVTLMYRCRSGAEAVGVTVDESDYAEVPRRRDAAARLEGR